VEVTAIGVQIATILVSYELQGFFGEERNVLACFRNKVPPAICRVSFYFCWYELSGEQDGISMLQQLRYQLHRIGDMLHQLKSRDHFIFFATVVLPILLLKKPGKSVFGIGIVSKEIDAIIPHDPYKKAIPASIIEERSIRIKKTSR